MIIVIFICLLLLLLTPLVGIGNRFYVLLSYNRGIFGTSAHTSDDWLAFENKDDNKFLVLYYELTSVGDKYYNRYYVDDDLTDIFYNKTFYKGYVYGTYRNVFITNNFIPDNDIKKYFNLSHICCASSYFPKNTKYYAPSYEESQKDGFTNGSISNTSTRYFYYTDFDFGGAGGGTGGTGGGTGGNNIDYTNQLNNINSSINSSAQAIVESNKQTQESINNMNNTISDGNKKTQESINNMNNSITDSNVSDNSITLNQVQDNSKDNTLNLVQIWEIINNSFRNVDNTDKSFTFNYIGGVYTFTLNSNYLRDNFFSKNKVLFAFYQSIFWVVFGGAVAFDIKKAFEKVKEGGFDNLFGTMNSEDKVVKSALL